MRVFLTGGTGFIGRNLAELYGAAGHAVSNCARGEDVAAALAAFAPDVVINCAAEIYAPSEMWAVNVAMVRDVLEYLRAHAAVKLIQLGSSSEYGPVERATCEADPIRPVDMYQATKGAATLLCQGYARQYGLDVAVVRPYSVYGRHERPHRLFPRLVRAFTAGEAMTLHQGFHDFIHIDDFVRGVDAVRLAGPFRGDIFNLGSGEQVSNFEVLELFKRASGASAPPVTLVDGLAKSFESAVWRCDTTLSRQKLGFTPQVSLQRGIERLLAEA